MRAAIVVQVLQDLFLFFMACFILLVIAPLATATCLSVRPSVRYIRYCMKTERASVMISSPSDSPMTSLSGEVWLVEKFARGHPERRLFLRLGWVRTGDFCDFSTYKPPYLRNGARLLLNTNRKPHKRFRLVPKSTTLDYLELTLNGHYAFFTLHTSFGAHHKNMNKVRPMLSAAKM